MSKVMSTKLASLHPLNRKFNLQTQRLFAFNRRLLNLFSEKKILFAFEIGWILHHNDS